MRAALVTLGLASVALFALASSAYGLPPHVPTEADTDACAMCHRSHTSASDLQRPDYFGGELTDPDSEIGSALIVGTFNNLGDVGLCYVCHGVDSLGSVYDVQTAFSSESSHTLAPELAPWGAQPMDCSTCHDSHGTERDVDGDPYAALLRSFSATMPGEVYYQGDEYCASCHIDRADDVWDGIQVWNQTSHSSEITPTTDTGITCVACHAAHGSDNRPLIVEQLVPPAASTTLTVPANDRWLCFGCHPGPQDTYPGGLTYQTSGHAVSTAATLTAGEWGSLEGTRTVGECQNCHRPMGASDGAGGVVPKLAAAEGRALCESCHNAESTIASDFAQFAFPETEASKLELAAAWNADRLPGVFDRVSIWTQDTTGTAPRSLVGPRVSEVPSSSVDACAGDIDGDAMNDLIVADGSSERLIIFEHDELVGLVSASYSIDATPTYVGVGDVFAELDGTGLPEIVVVSRSEATTPTSNLYVYRYRSSVPDLELVEGPIALGDDASGLALGDVRGTAAADIAVTCMGDDTLRVFTESTTVGDALDTYSYATRSWPRGPSIGDAVTSAGNEIVVANSGESVGTISVFTGSGSIIGSYDATVSATGVPYDTLVADVLPDVAGAETVIAMRSELGTGGFNVFERAAGLTSMQTYSTSQYDNTSSLASGDVDSDDNVELIVGNAGHWATSTTSDRIASVYVYSATSSGDALSTTPVTLLSDGVQNAGNPPALVPVDLGVLGESRHPVSVAEGAHVSTETTPFTARHVECVDCHNTHEATTTPAPNVAPLDYGYIKGTWGVSITNGATPDTISYSQKRGIDYEYELCFKCHSGWTETPWSEDDIAAQFHTANASFHAVETSTTNAMATSGSFVATSPAWTNSSMLYCIDCHGNSDSSQPEGPHSSEDAPLLHAPYRGATSDTAAILCYECHKYTVYASGTADGGPTGSGSNYYDASRTGDHAKLHYQHVWLRGFGCETCHVSHGIDREHLIRDELDWIHTDNGGACYTPCHSDSTANAYSRVSGESAPSSYSLVRGTLASGDLDSLLAQDADVMQIQEVSPPAPGFQLELTFGSIAYTPTSFELYGYYDGSLGHKVYVYAYDQVSSTWVLLGQIVGSTSFIEATYPLGDSRFVSGTGQVQIRIVHESPGNTSHNLYLDKVWLRQ